MVAIANVGPCDLEIRQNRGREGRTRTRAAKPHPHLNVPSPYVDEPATVYDALLVDRTSQFDFRVRRPNGHRQTRSRWLRAARIADPRHHRPRRTVHPAVVNRGPRARRTGLKRDESRHIAVVVRLREAVRVILAALELIDIIGIDRRKKLARSIALDASRHNTCDRGKPGLAFVGNGHARDPDVSIGVDGERRGPVPGQKDLFAQVAGEGVVARHPIVRLVFAGMRHPDVVIYRRDGHAPVIGRLHVECVHQRTIGAIFAEYSGDVLRHPDVAVHVDADAVARMGDALRTGLCVSRRRGQEAGPESRGDNQSIQSATSDTDFHNTNPPVCEAKQ